MTFGVEVGARILVPIVALAIAAGACTKKHARYPLAEPMWVDPDATPFAGEPKEYWSPFGWDTADLTLFRPVSRFFAVAPGGEAANVNALDEVPDSSWFVNRIGRFGMTPEEAARGVCTGPPMETEGPWTITGAKPNGANPGFIMKAGDGRRYLLKFDGLEQPERATAADVIGSLIYHAVGFYVPCNNVVFFDRAILRIGEGAKSENPAGKKIPLTWDDIDKVLSKGTRYTDGRYRAAASLFLDGLPIGPWKYQGVRRDDPNDVIPHEDRRELRGGMVLAAWLNHFDCREQNTLATWHAGEDGRGYIVHNYIDFGDTLGSFWETEHISERHGHSNYLDFSLLLEDWVTFGAIKRPWDGPEYGASGATLGYFSVKRFKPDKWVPGYPNPAHVRMTERDAVWMARILADLTDAHLEAIIARGMFTRKVDRDELFRILKGRRDLVLRRYLVDGPRDGLPPLGRLSPLKRPILEPMADGVDMCLRDMAVAAGLVPAATRVYGASAWAGAPLSKLPDPAVRALPEASSVCLRLPPVPGASATAPVYMIVDVRSETPGERNPGPARVHLYHLGGADYRVAGLERPKIERPPRY